MLQFLEHEEILNQKINILDTTASECITGETPTTNPYFIEIAILEKGETFGLQNMFCAKQPSLSLTSNGAEILLISRKFYLKHCSYELRERMIRTTPSYPSDETLQHRLRDVINWKRYKVCEVEDIIHRKELRRCKSALV